MLFCSCYNKLFLNKINKIEYCLEWHYWVCRLLLNWHIFQGGQIVLHTFFFSEGPNCSAPSFFNPSLKKPKEHQECSICCMVFGWYTCENFHQFIQQLPSVSLWLNKYVKDIKWTLSYRIKKESKNYITLWDLYHSNYCCCDPRTAFL